MTDHAYCIPDHVVLRQLGDELVLLDLESGTYFGLDPIGARILHLLQQGETAAAIGRDLAGTYDVDAATARQDTLDLIAQLLAQGLVALPAGPATP